ncbi:MAG: hypothetical protein ACR2OR_17770 [Hyphomicrobiales bacterium]
MSIFSKLRQLVSGLDVSDDNSGKENLDAAVLTEDADMLGGGDEAEPVLDGLRLNIRYVDVDGKPSNRLISCKRFVSAEDGDRLLAFCHLNRVDRSFLISRIEQTSDQAGRTIEGGVEEFLRPFLAHTAEDVDTTQRATRNVLVEVGDELRILAFMAHADQSLQAEEDGLISLFVRKRAEELGGRLSSQYDHQQVMDWFRHQAPDLAALERSATRVAGRSEVNLRRVWQIAAKVMEADGEVTASELDRFHELAKTIDDAVSALQEAKSTKSG